MENQVSMLPQPTARPAGGVMRALTEVSESDHNTRNAMPPPPSATGLKRQGSNLPEPAQKRKTLVERAGEPLQTPATASRPQSAASQYAPSNNTLYRSSSNASTLSRATSISSRNTSNSSYTGSLSSGIRPPAIGSAASTVRPKTSYSKEKVFGAGSRTNTSLAHLQASHEAHANKSKKPSVLDLRSPRSMNQDPYQARHFPQKAQSMLDLSSSSPRRVPSVVVNMRNRNRDVSLTTQLNQLQLEESQQNPEAMLPPVTPKRQTSPSKILRASPALPVTPSPRPADTPVLRHKSTMKLNKFLTSTSNLENFDPDVPYQDWKRMFDDSRQMFEDAVNKMATAREETNTYKEQLTQVEQERSSQNESLISLKAEIRNLQFRIESLERTNADLRQDHERRLEELKREHQQAFDTQRHEQREEIDTVRNEHREELRLLKQRHQEELGQERNQKSEALSQVSTQGALEKQRHQIDLDRKDQEIHKLRLEKEGIESVLEREREINDDLRRSIEKAADNASSMESTRQGLQAKISYLESDNKSQSEAYAAMERRMNEAIAKSEDVEEKLRREETTRRKLHNQVQELKGNIRVFCRVRPMLTAEEELAKLSYPDKDYDSTEIAVRGTDEKNSLGKDVTKTHDFTFDRVFTPNQSNDAIFEEIQHLIQSALDGYNVCIFAYGQTGSGKTYTMSSDDGMIPKALRMIYERSKELEDRGWKYSMSGSFVEVYNEEIRDLLGDDKAKKYDVHHDPISNETTITNATILALDSKEQVESILSQAMSRRSVAATKANEHSSRSHSVFILKLVGKNSVTGEESKGVLNLVDLAGSERVKNAETSGQRFTETKAINKSLSSLGDVIEALGKAQAPGDARSSLTNGRESLSLAHIPYRNSKLTHLLQMSLGGNCKTLMFVMVAPEKKCLSETITSLQFAKKASKTKVGVARRVK